MSVKQLFLAQNVKLVLPIPRDFCPFDEGSTYLATAEMSQPQTTPVDGLHVDTIVECSVVFLRPVLAESESDP